MLYFCLGYYESQPKRLRSAEIHPFSSYRNPKQKFSKVRNFVCFTVRSYISSCLCCNMCILAVVSENFPSFFELFSFSPYWYWKNSCLGTSHLDFNKKNLQNVFWDDYPCFSGFWEKCKEIARVFGSRGILVLQKIF